MRLIEVHLLIADHKSVLLFHLPPGKGIGKVGKKGAGVSEGQKIFGDTAGRGDEFDSFRQIDDSIDRRSGGGDAAEPVPRTVGNTGEDSLRRIEVNGTFVADKG
jgi:hypothetical protein